jgi:small subunit ribosomal protein S9
MDMSTKATEKYVEGIGRRKTAIARVRISEAGKNSFVINDKSLDDYFPATYRSIVEAPLKLLELPVKYSVSVHVKGSGPHAQAEAIRHGLSRAILSTDLLLKGTLKKAGFLKRDSRAVERKHFGFKKARKSSQWSKR